MASVPQLGFGAIDAGLRLSCGNFLGIRPPRSSFRRLSHRVVVQATGQDFRSSTARFGVYAAEARAAAENSPQARTGMSAKSGHRTRSPRTSLRPDMAHRHSVRRADTWPGIGTYSPSAGFPGAGKG